MIDGSGPETPRIFPLTDATQIMINHQINFCNLERLRKIQSANLTEEIRSNYSKPQKLRLSRYLRNV